MTSEQRAIIVDNELTKAFTFLSDAENLAEMDMWNVVANRAYYALFHALLAMMIHDGYSPQTHSGLITEFGKEYILTGKFDVKYSRLLSQMRIIREKCDYDTFYYAEKEQMLPIVTDTRILIQLISDTVKNA